MSAQLVMSAVRVKPVRKKTMKVGDAGLVTTVVVIEAVAGAIMEPFTRRVGREALSTGTLMIPADGIRFQTTCFCSLRVYTVLRSIVSLSVMSEKPNFTFFPSMNT